MTAGADGNESSRGECGWGVEGEQEPKNERAGRSSGKECSSREF